MKFQIYKIILVIALCLSLCACSQEPKAIVLPDVDDIVSIQISFDEITESHKDAHQRNLSDMVCCGSYASVAGSVKNMPALAFHQCGLISIFRLPGGGGTGA